jgi:hypothetical protein
MPQACLLCVADKGSCLLARSYLYPPISHKLHGCVVSCVVLPECVGIGVILAVLSLAHVVR